MGNPYNIVKLDEMRPHFVSEVICLKCLKRWIAIFPQITLLKELQCPQCNEQGFVIKTGQDIGGDRS
jgi:DNA-directed RNA polymerase subunit RPC12/RpoP